MGTTSSWNVGVRKWGNARPSIRDAGLVIVALVGWGSVSNFLGGCTLADFNTQQVDGQPTDDPGTPNTDPTDVPPDSDPNDPDTASDPDPPDDSIDDPIEDPPVDPSDDGGALGDPTDDPPVVPEDVPANEYCAPTSSWASDDSLLEEQVLELINERRASGASCGSRGEFEPASPLTSVPTMRCAARRHAMDMADRGFFDHTSPEGDGPGERLGAAGYDGSAWGENIALGQPTALSVVNAWMGSDGHCANIMNANYSGIGIGHFSGDYWVQTFGIAP